MTDKKISELTSITGANVSDANDVLPIVDTSVATTKKITRAELFKSVSSVDINGGTIDGTVIGGSTPAAISGTTGQFGTSLNVDGTVTADGLTVQSGNVLCGSDGGGDIGSSTKRFKDLYLSGGVKFDGVTKLQGDAYIVGGSATHGIRFNNNNDTKNNLIINDDGSTWIRNGIYLGAIGNFSAANHLDDYEEGTWTPTDASGAGLAISTNAASYTKIGGLCYIYAYIGYPSTANGAGQITGGLPFTAKSGATYAQLTIRSTSNTVSASNLTFQVTASGTSGGIYNGAAALVNSDISATNILISGCYEVA